MASSASARSGTALAKAWYLVSEWLATFCPTAVVTDARDHPGLLPRALRQGERRSFPTARKWARWRRTAALAELGLEPGRYFLYVSRMEPENHPLEVRAGFRAGGTPMKLALIGDAPYAQRIHPPRARHQRPAHRDARARSTAQGYRELGSHCFAYIHATEVGGTHPALIEAMGRGALVLYRDTPENAEVAGDAGIPFEPDELGRARCGWCWHEPRRSASSSRRKAMERVREHYSWDAVTDAYEKLLTAM